MQIHYYVPYMAQPLRLAGFVFSSCLPLLISCPFLWNSYLQLENKCKQGDMKVEFTMFLIKDLLNCVAIFNRRSWVWDHRQCRAYNEILLEGTPEWRIFIGKHWPSRIYEIMEITKERVHWHRQLKPIKLPPKATIQCSYVTNLLDEERHFQSMLCDSSS